MNITEIFHSSEWLGLWGSVSALVIALEMWLFHSPLYHFSLLGGGMGLMLVGLSLKIRKPPIIGEEPK